ncbi:MinD/ParA family ATP-binding protein [Cellulomonas endophytica]|uniref:MinD/ParA family ATP-binding protein n=1 Tax=Cellulomonas endophytica TaxID=2494735 RepID=UPI0010103D3C|nr:chromosome partitioning protein [Cellulomonas endophytica]
MSTGTTTGPGAGGEGAAAPVRARLRPDGTGELTIAGTVEPLQGADLAAVGAAVTERVARLAAVEGRPVPVEVRDPDGLWWLLVHPDGRVDEAPTPPGPDAPPTPAPRAAGAGASRHSGPATGTAAAGARPSGRREQDLPTLDDLLAQRRSEATGGAEWGWRRAVRTVTGGRVAPGPGRAERRHRDAVASVRRHLDGPRTVVVVNPKGGATKTTATLLLAATFGLHRGGSTLAWDNNETRGTLGWRSAHEGHTRTAVDLLRDLPGLTRSRNLRLGDLDGYVRSQPRMQFDVLASDEDAASAASVDADAFHALHAVLQRYYRVTVVDTGNNMRASNWQAAVEVADQIVVVSTVREDTAQSAAWALDALRATGHDEKVRQAVTVLAAPAATVDRDLRDRLRTHFGALTRAVVEVPHDEALVSGGPLQWDALRRPTQDAWLHATAVVAEGL